MASIDDFLQYCKGEGHSFTAADIASVFDIPSDTKEEDYPDFISNLAMSHINSLDIEDEELKGVTGGGFLITMGITFLVAAIVNNGFKIGQKLLQRRGQRKLAEQESNYASELEVKMASIESRIKEAELMYGVNE